MNENIKKLKEWIDNPEVEKDIRAELTQLLDRYEADENNEALQDDIDDRFYKDMKFGTGGLRGKIGAGTNRMNVHTVRRVCRAFSAHLLQKCKSPSVVIAYDNRKYSDLFALASARVYEEKGIKVWLFPELTPTPMLSYGVRRLKATGGVMVTASHNPGEYNGYKLYDGNGCQYLPEEAEDVARIMEGLDIFQGISKPEEESPGGLRDRIGEIVSRSELISLVPPEVDSDYYDEVLAERAFRGRLMNVSAVYTPLNGTGNIPVTTVLRKAGIGKLYTVEKQEQPDPDFTSCPKPNPEEEEALREGLKLCESLEKAGDGPDILMATDPDCDRVGIMVRDRGEYKRLDGNQVGVLLLDYITESLREQNRMPENPVMVTTIVSTPMAYEIAHKKGVCEEKVLTGFKYIGDRIAEYDSKGTSDRFIYGFEESCGYLAGTYVRDKDGVSATLLIADMVGFYKEQGKTLTDRMEELYGEYGCYLTSLESFERTGPRGAEEIALMMQNLRDPEIISGFHCEVVRFLDYDTQTGRTAGSFDDGDCSIGEETGPTVNLPRENVLEFAFKDRSKVIVRPSGTEPKIKIYFSAAGESRANADKSMEAVKKAFKAVLRL